MGWHLVKINVRIFPEKKIGPNFGVDRINCWPLGSRDKSTLFSLFVGKNYQTTRRDDVRARDASAHLEYVFAAQQTHVLNFVLPCAQRLRPTDSIRMCLDSATFISTHSKQAWEEIDFFLHESILKIFYLLRVTSILRTDFTNVFYATRRTKLDPTCICFNNILH